MKAKSHRKVYKNCDLSGQRFGRLFVTSEYGFTGLHRHWICKCDCGKTAVALATNLKRGNTKSCGCLAVDEGWTQPGSKSAHWKGYGEISGHYWGALKASAKSRDIPFDLTIEDAWQKFLAQNRLCALTGTELFFGQKFADQQTASLDRTDSSKGYTLDNVQWVQVDVNMMKRDMSVERFVELCRGVVNHVDTKQL